MLEKIKGMFLKGLFKYASSEKRGDLASLFESLAKVAPDNYQKNLKTISNLIAQGHPWGELWKRAVKNTNPLYRQKFLIDFFVNSLVYGVRKRKAFRDKEGFWPPYLIMVSPTMRCNLRCKGCYAWRYRESSDMSLEFVDRLIGQARDMGIYFVVISGGEPFLREDMFEIYKKYSDVVFHVYTNGTFLTKRFIKEKILPCGNIIPLVSVEGFEEATDFKRGPGAFKKIMQAMDNLRELGVPFGTSIMHTRLNHQDLMDDKFVDMLVEKGVLLAWVFQYMPIGQDPDLSLIPTPRQRLERLQTVLRWRNTKPIFMVDFWGDGGLVGGCIAAGRRYIDIIPASETSDKILVKPCVFVPFGDLYSQKEFNLTKVLQSKFFLDIRRRQPYHDPGEENVNLIRPCQIIDRPQVLREVVAQDHPVAAYSGAENLLKGDIGKFLDNLSEEWKKIADPVWRKNQDKLTKLLLSKEGEEGYKLDLTNVPKRDSSKIQQ